ncbi:MAG TPA: transposase, partial [Candidatus Nitrosotalea sp.]|nr:transposase [Candidatus Nitrosotalea sp.]
MTKRLAPSAALETAIEELLSQGLGDAEQLAEVGRLGARLVLQRALEDEVAEFLGRARYERSAQALGSRNGVRPRRVQTAEGELELQMPQLRDTADRFVSQVLPQVRSV